MKSYSVKSCFTERCSTRAGWSSGSMFSGSVSIWMRGMSAPSASVTTSTPA